MNALTDRAHARNMNVVLDYVGNHVHEDHPLMDVHPDWTTDLYLPDGSLNTERWDEHRLTTWFDTFMPTLDLERPEVAEAMSDSAAWWALHSGIDGFRHDATKHISEVFWRKLTAKLKAAQQRSGKRLFQIGETYGSPDLIGSYLSSGMLDAQFDFNLYDKAVGAIAFEEGNWEDLVATNKPVCPRTARTTSWATSPETKTVRASLPCGREFGRQRGHEISGMDDGHPTFWRPGICQNATSHVLPHERPRNSMRVLRR